MDEKGFLIGVLQKMQRVYSKEAFQKGNIVAAGQDGNREWITLIATICMDGSWIPPTLIYQAVSGDIQDTWVTEVDPKEHQVHFASTATGWTNENLGYKWLTTVFDRFSKAKARQGRDYRLLILDGHNSHLNIRFLDWCGEHKVLVAYFPSHSTHRLQPLDVSIFGPLAQYYSEEADLWLYKCTGLRSFTKRDFFAIFWPAFLKAFSEKNILSAFKKAGLQPKEYDHIIKAITRQPLEEVEHSSGSSILSNLEVRVVRRFIETVVDKKVNKKTRKLVNTVEALTAQNELLKHENNNLRSTIIEEKNQRARGKGLFEQMRDEQESKALIFSPNKIQQARDRFAEKERQEAQEQLQKDARKIKRQFNKQQKERDLEQRKIDREIAKAERAKRDAKLKAQRIAKKEQQVIDKQLKAEGKLANKKPGKKPIQIASPKKVHVAVKSPQNNTEPVFLFERLRRQPKPTEKVRDKSE